MNLTVHIPDALATRLRAVNPDLERQALEALVLESFRAGRMTLAELRETLGFAVLDEVDGFLKAHGVYDPYGIADLEQERESLDALGL